MDRQATIASRERAADWTTALVPTVMMAVLYYRWSAVALMVTAVAGYLAASWLVAWISRQSMPQCIWSSVAPGVLIACTLPATAPWWLSALLGGMVALLVAVMPCAQKIRLSIHPVLPVAMLARAAFPTAVAVYTVPSQFVPVDGVTAATPLALVAAGEPLPEWWRLLFGVHAGAIGDGCAVAILLGFAVLALRRRVRLVAPGCFLATVMLLAWVLYGSWQMALATPLLGGCLLGAWLFADELYAPQTALDQAVVGVIAGAVTVLVRQFGSWSEGVAIGVLTGQLLLPLLSFIYRGTVALRWRICQLLKKEK